MRDCRSLVSADREKALEELIDAADEATAYALIDNTRRRVFRLDGGAPTSSCCCAARR